MGLKRGGFGIRTARLAAKVPLKADPAKTRAWQQNSRTELGRTGLAGGAGPKRSAPPADKPKTPQQVRRDQQLRDWAAVRLTALARDDGKCVRCGKPAQSVHHRAGKGAGGSRLLDVVENAVSVCGLDNATGCHGFAHQKHNTDAAAIGLSVPRGGDYAAWPVRYSDAHGGGDWLLLPDGTKERVG